MGGKDREKDDDEEEKEEGKRGGKERRGVGGRGGRGREGRRTQRGRRIRIRREIEGKGGGGETRTIICQKGASDCVKKDIGSYVTIITIVFFTITTEATVVFPMVSCPMNK